MQQHNESAEYSSEIEDALLKIWKNVKAAREALFEEGLVVSNPYFRTLKKTNFTHEQASISPRVRVGHGGSPSFSWEKIIKKYRSAILHPTTKKSNGSGKSYLARVKKENGSIVKTKVCLTSKHIKINSKTKSISPGAFKDQPLWAQIAGEATEKKLCSLRKQEAALSRIVKNIAVIKGLRSKENIDED